MGLSSGGERNSAKGRGSMAAVEGEAQRASVSMGRMSGSDPVEGSPAVESETSVIFMATGVAPGLVAMAMAMVVCSQGQVEMVVRSRGRTMGLLRGSGSRICRKIRQWWLRKRSRSR